MSPELLTLVNALLRPIPIAIDTEEGAIELIMQTRWPSGRTCTFCHHPSVRHGIWLRCACEDDVTIFIGTPLGGLTRPSVRGILLALRAMAMDHRGIGARPLARLLSVPHVTLWRHIHLLRALLPPVPTTSDPVADVLVCGRKAMHAACVRVGGRAFRAWAGPRHHGFTPRRLVGESVRTWLNGTFHGVTARYLRLYVREAMCRAWRPPRHMVVWVLAQIARC